MAKNQIREPRQERSIDKKNKIIETAYEVFSTVGYYNTNTADIAKKAGVSTGIVYGYFKDKRDILLYVTKIYMEKVTLPLAEYLGKIKEPLDLKKEVPELLEIVIKIHKSNANLHNTLHSLAVTDESVSREFLHLEERITEETAKRLGELGVSTEHLKEKAHIAMNLIQSFAHEYVYDKHSYINYKEMKKSVCKMIVVLFE